MVEAQQDSTLELKQLLNLSVEQLLNVKVVTASGFLQNASQASSTITVITARQIQERGYEQLEDALRDVPGIDMVHINGYAPTLIYFRGMYGAENLRALPITCMTSNASRSSGGRCLRCMAPTLLAE
jgi:outer membrane receptor for ferrienterochelin and colicin